MGYKKGDKFIIEIGNVIGNGNENTLYKMKGFNTLIFDNYGLDRLEKIKDDKFDFKVGQGVISKEDETFGIIISRHDWLYVVWNEDGNIVFYKPEDLTLIDFDESKILCDVHNKLIKKRYDVIFKDQKTN